ncbi:MAG: hypothetical protein IJC30_03725 [Alphaproteobacteria bacterium]|nr:hypothetical protein [Alphaproteobacteria bacterium]
MEKAKNVKEFVERMDAQKKKNPKDLSSDQDLTIGIMNLISIEEHLIFSGAKTGKTSFYDMVYEIREMRKNLMLKVIPSYEGEVWCISKHLLSASMRLLEVGTKQLGMGRKEEAYKLFDQSYDLYCMFWGLNMNLIDTKDVKWINNDEEKVKEITAQLEEAEKTDLVSDIKTEEKSEPVLVGKEETTEAGSSFFGKMKSVIRKAVDCCIE